MRRTCGKDHTQSAKKIRVVVFLVPSLLTRLFEYTQGSVLYAKHVFQARDRGIPEDLTH